MKFSTIQKRSETLKLKRLLYKEGDQDFNIFIHPDRTPKELERYRALVKELKDRKLKGETNIPIINGNTSVS